MVNVRNSGPRAAAGATVLALRGIEKHYGTEHNRVPVLRGIDLTVASGDYVAVIGPSGSGKSTLLNILGCLDRPSAGAYLFGGEDIARQDDRRLSHIRNRRIGFVFQSFQLVPHLSVLENVEMPLFYARISRRERQRRCTALIERVGLGHRLTHVPSELSGGECQRAAIARALVNEPALVLADEPTGNLDSATGSQILGLVRELHGQGVTIVMITHDREVAAAARRRIELLDGRIAADEAGAGGAP
jgi:putative ABC transport system ATP-binding protein